MTSPSPLELYKLALEAASQKDVAALRKYAAEAITADPMLRGKALSAVELTPYLDDVYLRRTLYPQERVNLGVDTMYQGDMEGALSFFKQYVLDEPQDYRGFFYLSICLCQFGKFEESLEAIDQSIILKNTFADGYFTKGSILEQLKRYEDAAGAYQQAMEHESNYANAMYNLGLVYVHFLEKNQEAIDLFTKLISLEPEYVNLVIYKRALAYAKLGKKKEMMEDLQRAILGDPLVKKSITENTSFDVYKEDPDFAKMIAGG